MKMGGRCEMVGGRTTCKWDGNLVEEKLARGLTRVNADENLGNCEWKKKEHGLVRMTWIFIGRFGV